MPSLIPVHWIVNNRDLNFKSDGRFLQGFPYVIRLKLLQFCQTEHPDISFRQFCEPLVKAKTALTMKNLASLKQQDVSPRVRSIGHVP